MALEVFINTLIGTYAHSAFRKSDEPRYHRLFRFKPEGGGKCCLQQFPEEISDD